MYMISLWPKWENIDLGRWASHLCLLQGLFRFQDFRIRLNLRKFLLVQKKENYLCWKILLVVHLLIVNQGRHCPAAKISGMTDVKMRKKIQVRTFRQVHSLPSLPQYSRGIRQKSWHALQRRQSRLAFPASVFSSVVSIPLISWQKHLYSMLHSIPGRWQHSPPSHICHTLAGSHRGAPHQPHQARPWANRLGLYRKFET